MEKSVKGQLQLSYGMIFSIILIIIFLGFAFYAIYKFFGITDEMKVGKFKIDIQDDIDKMWKGGQGSQERSYNLPKKINAVCIQDDEYANLRFESDGYFEGVNLKHINLEKILGNSEEYCIENENGKVKLILKMDYGENSITILRQN